jgi:hypothetical protein
MTRQILTLPLVMLVAATLMFGQTDSSQHSTVPEMDGGAGPCSCQLTVLTPDGKPAGAADVKVHIAYGFGGFRRLDLDAGTNYDGKVNFTGLPAKVKNPPLEFHASKDQWTGVATFDPAVECEAKHDITMQKADSGQK